MSTLVTPLKERVDIRLEPMRWEHDKYETLRLEVAAFPQPWAAEDFLFYYRQQACAYCLVARDPKELFLGYAIGLLLKNELEIVSLAVEAEARRKGIGAQMVREMMRYARKKRKKAIELSVSEGNTPAQLFFRSLGFYWVKTLRNEYPGDEQDCYIMRRNLI